MFSIYSYYLNLGAFKDTKTDARYIPKRSQRIKNKRLKKRMNK